MKIKNLISHFLFIPSAILLVALIIRIWFLPLYGDMYWDELFSFHFGTIPLAEAVRYWLFETNPPFHMFLLHLWFYVFPVLPEYGRILSVIIGTVSIPVIYYFGQLVGGRRVGILTATIAAISATCVEASLLARGYGLLFLLTILSNIWFLKTLNIEQPLRRNYWLGIITNLALLLTHLTAILVPLIQLLTVLAVDKKRIKSWYKIWLAPGILALAWIGPSFFLKLGLPSLGSAWFLNIHTAPLKYLTGIGSIILPGATAWSLVGFIIFLVATMFATKRLVVRYSMENMLSILGALLPIFIAIGMGVWNIKFYYIALPAVFILVAVLLSKLKASIAIFLITVISFVNLHSFYAGLPRINWAEVRYKLSLLDPNNTCAIVDETSINWLTLSRYLPDKNWQLYTPGNNIKNIWLDTVINNYSFYKRDPAEFVNWWQRSRLQLNSCVIIFAEETRGVNMGKILPRLGWNKVSEQPINLLPINRLEKYEKY